MDCIFIKFCNKLDLFLNIEDRVIVIEFIRFDIIVGLFFKM